MDWWVPGMLDDGGARRRREVLPYHNAGRIPSPAERDRGEERSEFAADNLLTKCRRRHFLGDHLYSLLLSTFSRSYSKLELLDGARR